MKTATNIKVKYRNYIKSRLVAVRATGIVLSLVTIIMLILQHFKILENPLFNCVSIVYMCGALFTVNAQYQDLRLAKGWARFNRILATLFYIITVALLVIVLLDRFYVISL